MSILGFSHYNLRAPRPQLDQLRDFYCEVVGLTAGPRPAFNNFGYWLYAGGRDVLHLTEMRPDEVRQLGARASFDHAAFNCSGRSEVEQRLARHGIAYEVGEVPLTGQVQLFFSDPAGNGVELNFAASDR
ncbi:VOC family protein [Pelomonas sp. SE-A7]|uniref:VOC family protein n=1 Tax=Pelomonas sp. SE-A7 TaxID=3054953 RepID=UPI00259CD685|nr:VOC family protein [Pelomonas sp. SE-A7]MDM4766535.1 diguanylate cyclase [Pelomonas sp. SE-A7]